LKKSYGISPGLPYSIAKSNKNARCKITAKFSMLKFFPKRILVNRGNDKLKSPLNIRLYP
jgi:hypothetical protein